MTSSSTASTSAACSASTTTPTRSTRRRLLVPLVRFLPPDDERVRATVLAIRDELTENGLVLRYRTEETDDGLHGEEGTFLICSFWLVSALSEIGEHREAEHLCERLLSYASPLELYAEELEASSGRHLGNYPQAFTHLALINAVTHVIDGAAAGLSGTRSVAGLAGQQHARDLALEHDPRLDGLRPRARARASSSSSHRGELPSCSRCLIVGKTSTISSARWASSAAGGVNQPRSTHSSPSTCGSWPCGSAARKKWVSKRILHLRRRDPARELDELVRVVERDRGLLAQLAHRGARGARSSPVALGSASTAPPGNTHTPPMKRALRRSPARAAPRALVAAAQQDHGRRLARRRGRAGVVLLARSPARRSA